MKKEKSPVEAVSSAGLHIKEQELAKNRLRISFDLYRCQKKRMMLSFVLYKSLANRTPSIDANWNVTRAQQVCNADANVMSVLFMHFKQWGWMIRGYMPEEYVVDKLANYDSWVAWRTERGTPLEEYPY